MNLERIVKNPLILSFETLKGHYIYDASSNEIIKTDPLTYALIKKEIGVDELSTDQVAKRVSSLSRLTEKGIFSTYRFNEMGFPIEEDEIRHRLRNGIQEMVFNLTEKCNLRCEYCAYSGSYKYRRTHSNNSIDMGIVRKAIDFFGSVSKESPTIYIGFYGGEPFLEFDLIKRVITYSMEKFEGRERVWAITTNGTLIDEEDVEFLVSNNVILTVSLDGPEDIHDLYRLDVGKNPSFKRVYRTLRRLKNFDPNYYDRHVNFSITVSPHSDLKKIRKFFSEDELVKGHLCFFSNIDPFDTTFFDKHPVSQEENHEFNLTLAQFREDYIRIKSEGREDSFLSSLFRKRIKNIHFRPLGNTPRIKPNGMCVPGLKRIFVSGEGKFYPCEKVGEFFEIGDVNKGLDEEKVIGIINEYFSVSSNDCLSCWASRFCNLCLNNAKKGGSISIERKRKHCSKKRLEIEEDLKTYVSILEANPSSFDNLSPLGVFE